MLFRRTVALTAAALLAAGPSFSNETDKKAAKPAEASAGWTESQMVSLRPNRSTSECTTRFATKASSIRT